MRHSIALTQVADEFARVHIAADGDIVPVEEFISGFGGAPTACDGRELPEKGNAIRDFQLMKLTMTLKKSKKLSFAP